MASKELLSVATDRHDTCGTPLCLWWRRLLNAVTYIDHSKLCAVKHRPHGAEQIGSWLHGVTAAIIDHGCLRAGWSWYVGSVKPRHAPRIVCTAATACIVYLHLVHRTSAGTPVRRWDVCWPDQLPRLLPPQMNSICNSGIDCSVSGHYENWDCYAFMNFVVVRQLRSMRLNTFSA